jgi:sulfide:quinone oxidoreductase
LGDDYLIADQLRESDLARIAEAGIQTVINLRPDNEADDQPTAEALAGVAHDNGLVYHHIPVGGRRPPEDTIQAFEAVRRRAGGTVLGFCGSGTRAAVLWAYEMAPLRPVDEVLGACAACGYEFDRLRTRLVQRQSGATVASTDT